MHLAAHVAMDEFHLEPCFDSRIASRFIVSFEHVDQRTVEELHCPLTDDLYEFLL